MALGLTAAEVKAVLDRRTQLPFKQPTEFTELIRALLGGGRQGFAVVPGGQPGPANPTQIIAELSQTATVSAKNFSVTSAGRMTGSRLTVRVAAILRNDGAPGRPKLSVRLWSLDPRQGGV